MGHVDPFWSTSGQWSLLLPALLALVLSALVGLEREVRAKSAGLRTHTLVGFGAAVLTLISKYGFFDVIGPNTRMDPSRIAANIVTGIGFIGGGLIFVRRDVVRGLTTAATIWVVAAVGMAAGAGLPVLAVATTAGHFLVNTAFRPLAHEINRRRGARPGLHLEYLDGRGVLRGVLAACTEQGWVVEHVEVDRELTSDDGQRIAGVVLQLIGKGVLPALAAELAQLPGVRAARLVTPVALEEQ